MSQSNVMNTLLERHPYRYIETENGDRGYIEKYNFETKRWYNMYECDSRMQLLTAMEDISYTRWLDSDNPINCTSDVIKSPYSN
jgi:hypothetical protein